MKFKFNGDVILDGADQVILIKMVESGSLEDVIKFWFTEKKDLMKESKKEKDWSEDANRIFALYGFEKYHKTINPEFDIIDYGTSEVKKKKGKE